MDAEVIAVGDELTSGQRLDTNTQWLSQQLADLGIPVLYHTTVGDVMDAHVRVLQQAFERADVVLCTGGLGPTADDLTRQALATATKTGLVSDPVSLAHIRAVFARRKREMPDRNMVQALFPEGSRPIPNEHGTAPGIEMPVARDGRSPCYVLALPGVPAEMKAMWTESVSQSLAQVQTGPRQVIRHKCVKCYGAGESELERMLPDLIRRGREPTVGITASRTTITLRITARGLTDEACQRQMAPTLDSIHKCLGSLVYGYDEDELQDAVVRLLRQNHQSLATAEVGTGGLLADWLSDADGAGDVYLGGLVLRGRKSDVDLSPGDESSGESPMAAIFRRSFAAHGDDLNLAARDAEAVRQLLQADFGLAVGTFPASDSADNPAGELRVGLASQDRALCKSLTFAGHPDLVKVRAAKQTLNLLRLWVSKKHGKERANEE